MNESLSLAEALANFHFLRPWWLLGLLPALWFSWILWHRNEQGSAWQKAIDNDLLPYLLDKNQHRTQRTPLILLLTAWLLAIVALAGPTWDRISQPVQKRMDALVIVLDQSLAMFATDYDPNRLTIARRKVLDILDRRVEGQTALVVYSGEAHMVTPLTEDSISIRAMVPALSPNIMPVFGNNPSHGIELGVNLLQEAGFTTGRLLLITGDVPVDQTGRIRELLNGSGYELSILGVGTERGAPIPASSGDFLRDSEGRVITPRMDRNALQALSRSVDGRYHDAGLSASDIEHVLADSLLRDDVEFFDAEENFDIWYDAGPWLLLVLLPLSALIFRRGWILGLVLSGSTVLMVMTPTAPAHAFDWRDLWQTRDQQGASAYESEDPATAAQLFRSSRWRGAASYRAGDYETAIREFSQGDDADSFYNLGNALAFSERFEEAIAAYERALEIQENHEDALHNKQIIEDLLEQQEQEQESESAESEEEDDQQQEQDGESDPDGGESDQDDQDQQQDQQQDQNGEPEEQDNQESQDSESDSQEQQQEQRSANVEETEDQESLEQWLRRINDDPGELLQRKFQFEHRRRELERRAAQRAAGRQL